MNSRCIPLAEAVPKSAQVKCPFNCSGNGVSNQTFNCSCGTQSNRAQTFYSILSTDIDPRY